MKINREIIGKILFGTGLITTTAGVVWTMDLSVAGHMIVFGLAIVIASLHIAIRRLPRSDHQKRSVDRTGRRDGQ